MGCTYFSMQEPLSEDSRNFAQEVFVVCLQVQKQVLNLQWKEMGGLTFLVETLWNLSWRRGWSQYLNLFQLDSNALSRSIEPGDKGSPGISWFSKYPLSTAALPDNLNT